MSEITPPAVTPDTTETDQKPKTESLMSAEMQEEMKRRQGHAEKLSRITREIEDILIREDMSWNDWYEVVGLLGKRTSDVVGPMKVKTINEMYARTV